MRYLTDRKRAEGKGAAHSGAEHHWSMTLSAVGLAFLVPTWLYIFGSTLGGPRAEVLATFSHPFPAILTALVLAIGMRHFAMGATTMIEDYARGTAQDADHLCRLAGLDDRRCRHLRAFENRTLRTGHDCLPLRSA